jgi:RNA polymerase sigma-70 factor (ECF subfamily)
MGGDGPMDVCSLLDEARCGSADALGRLLELYRNYLTLLARTQIQRNLQAKADASDLVQEAFVEAQRGFGNFEGESEGELMQWLRSILARRVARLVRHYGTQRRDVRLERRLSQQLDRSSQALERALEDEHTTPSRAATRRESAVVLADALEGLPGAYRDVLALRHLEGLDFEDVAARMGRTVDSVKNLWSRALGQLRRRLNERP